MMNQLCVALVLGMLASSASGYPGDGASPKIVKEGGKLVLILPERMKAALAAYDSTFQPWEFDNYTLTIRSDPDYSELRAPFALITDVNADGIPDVIIDGRNGKELEMVCILSAENDFKTIQVDVRMEELRDPGTIENFNDGKKEFGLHYYLWLPHQKAEGRNLVFTLGIPQQAGEDGELLRDGLMIDYYFEEGRFVAERQQL